VEQGLESVAPLSVVTGLRYERPQQWFMQGDLVYNAAKKKKKTSDRHQLLFRPPSS
jgi:hemoglobin/transferrin/lactoferrin receptor protein